MERYNKTQTANFIWRKLRPYSFGFPLNKKDVGILIVVTIIIVALGIGLGIKFNRKHPEHIVKHVGSVVSNGVECAAIGGKILKEMNGSAADAAIATLFCEGIAVPQSCGLGGGFFLTIYKKSTGKVETLNAREMAPQAATTDMFVGEERITGIRSVAVPGELKGIWELHQRYGTLPWRTLIQPSIDLCRYGHVVSPYFGQVLKLLQNSIKSQEGLAEVYINPETNSVWDVGDLIRRPKLADTLELIADEGADTLYNNGTVARLLVNEVQELGGILTVQDFMNYTVRWNDSISTKFLDDTTIHTVPLPASGSVLILILNVLNGFLPSVRNVIFYQRFIESLKFAYAKRTELGDHHYATEAYEIFQKMLDLDYAQEIRSKIESDRTNQYYEYYGASFSMPDDHGTAHISVIAPNGDAIALTSSINTLLGSKIRSRTTGIILNDSMDDFSTPGVVNAFGVPASPSNFIAPGKQPFSSMCPTIVIDSNGDVKLTVGAAGGTRITSTVASIIISQLMFNETLAATIAKKRIHHQLVPMYIYYESGFNQTILQGLKEIGHLFLEETAVYGFAAVTGISREGNELKPVYDSRRQGSTFVY